MPPAPTRLQPSSPQPGVVDFAGASDVNGNGHYATNGVIHIECRKHAGEPSEYWSALAGTRLGCSTSAGQAGLTSDCALPKAPCIPVLPCGSPFQVLEAEPRHKIPNVTLTPG